MDECIVILAAWFVYPLLCQSPLHVGAGPVQASANQGFSKLKNIKHCVKLSFNPCFPCFSKCNGKDFPVFSPVLFPMGKWTSLNYPRLLQCDHPAHPRDPETNIAPQLTALQTVQIAAISVSCSVET